MSLLACMTLASAASQADPVKLLPSTLEMPDHIGPLTYTGQPTSWPDKRLGIAYSFTGPAMKLDVYVYDAGFTDIPDGAESTPVCMEFENAKYGVWQGGYGDVSLKREQLARTGPTADPPLMREAEFEAVIKGERAASYVWITGASKNFIKMRFSASTQLRDGLGEARHAILATLGDAIRPNLEPVTAPADGAVDKKKETRIVVNPDTGDDKPVGFAYLIALTAATSDHPELNPPCGGRLEPDFATELKAYESALKFAALPGSDKSKFGTQLLDVSNAGYLDEFVWQYQHRDFWGKAPPEGLELKEFKRWSKQHLKRFKMPVFGYVEVMHPRAMAVEPVE